MNARHVRWGLDLFTGLVVASVGVALAGLTWRLAGYSGVDPVVASAPAKADAVNAADVGPILALAPFGTALAAGDTHGDGSIRLKAIFVAIPAAASSVLIARSDGKVASYAVGAAVGGGVIDQIQTDQIILRKAGGLQAIGFATASAPTPSGYRVDGAVPPALIAAGLRPGDVIEQVNGAAVGAGTHTRDLLAQAMQAGSAQVVVNRAGQRMALNLAVH